MRFILAAVALWLAVPLPAQTLASAPPAASPQPPVARDLLILVSIDGFRADYLARGVTPALSALAATGATAPMRPSFPSLTFPNHYTLVTGLRPDHHGVVGNSFEDASLPGGVFHLGNFDTASDGRWWDEATPIWITASLAGIRTATMFWPGSEASIHGIRPDTWAHFDSYVKPGHRVDLVLDWLDEPVAKRPGFVTLYFDAVDHAGHVAGPDSPDVDAALTETDRAIGRLIDGLKARGLLDRTNLVIVADHGMSTIAPERTIWLDDLVDPSAVRTIADGAVGGYEPVPGREADAAKLVGHRAHVDCWRKADVPKRLHYGHNPRVPSLVCLAEPGWTIDTRANAAAHPSTLRGTHGYDPAAPDMAALFLAHGPAFAVGVRQAKAFDNVDVYPMMARALGIVPEPNDGTLDDVRRLVAP